ncbi:hypothetical protein DRN73_02530 [Candidatus Pacearchaeota archaeon]|nr:MAG: hypothetical protein DRN73_02530 [Candidatus Pacearchaeota archaeon]
MNINIIKEEQSPLFNRKEIYGIIAENVIPSKKDVAEFLSKKYSVPIDAIRILMIKGKFGTKEFEINANIYSSKEERDNLEKMSEKEKKTLETTEKKESSQENNEPAKSEEKIPAEKEIGINPVEEAKKLEEKKQEEDKKEKDKSKEEKLNE